MGDFVGAKFLRKHVGLLAGLRRAKHAKHQIASIASVLFFGCFGQVIPFPRQRVAVRAVHVFVVGFGSNVLRQVFMKTLVLAKQASEGEFLIRFAKLGSCEKAKVVGDPVIRFVVGDAFFEEGDSFFDPLVAILVVIEFHRYIERKIVPLILPDFDKVRLDFGQHLQRLSHFVVVFILFVLLSLQPKNVHRDSTQSQRGELHGLTGRVDFRNAGLG